MNKFLFALLKITKVVYNAGYFYFFPFAVLMLNYFSRNCEHTMVFTSDGSSIGTGGVV